MKAAAFSGPGLIPAVWVLCTTIPAVLSSLAPARGAEPKEKWVASWSASVQGPYPSGNPTAGPDLRFAFPDPTAGASDQSFRLMLRPGLWGRSIRVRFSNTVGTKPVEFDQLFVGLQATGGNVVRGTNRRVVFDGKPSLILPAGRAQWSDPVRLDFTDSLGPGMLDGRRLAVSFHVAGTSGPMTWHAKAMTTSYVSGPGAGAHSSEESDAAFPYSAASWFFVDAVDVLAPADTRVIAAFGDSITDGTNTTMNGDDRWPDELSRRLKAAYGDRLVVVNQGIGGNRITGPAAYGPEAPFAGGPSALNRFERDVLGLSGLAAIIWLEGINDLGSGGAPVAAVTEGMREIVRRARSRRLTIFGATLTSSLKSTSEGYGTAEVDRKRRELNNFIRTSGIFDGVFDFDLATSDPATGMLRPQFQPNSTVGGAGDGLHPNRAGMKAMADSIDIRLFAAAGSR